MFAPNAMNDFKTKARAPDLQFVPGRKPALHDGLAVDANTADAVQIVEIVTAGLPFDGGVPPAHARFDMLNVATSVAPDDERR